MKFEVQRVCNLSGTKQGLLQIRVRFAARDFVARHTKEVCLIGVELNVIAVVCDQAPPELNRPAAISPSAFGEYVRSAALWLSQEKGRQSVFRVFRVDQGFIC